MGTRQMHLRLCPVTRKLRFPQRKAALSQLNQARAQGEHVKRIYKCQFCKGWHLTSQENRNELARRYDSS